jgi:hypothetical protein
VPEVPVDVDVALTELLVLVPPGVVVVFGNGVFPPVALVLEVLLELEPLFPTA